MPIIYATSRSCHLLRCFRGGVPATVLLPAEEGCAGVHPSDSEPFHRFMNSCTIHWYKFTLLLSTAIIQKVIPPLLSLLIDCAQEAEILDEEQINHFLDLFVAKLPDL